jgi:hypothetical protein
MTENSREKLGSLVYFYLKYYQSSLLNILRRGIPSIVASSARDCNLILLKQAQGDEDRPTVLENFIP